MKPPPILKPSTSSSPIDPLLSLPKEIFLQLFRFSGSSEALGFAATSRGWRNTILSCPSLFSRLYLDEWCYNFSPENVQESQYHIFDEVEREVIPNRVIKRVLHLASLSGNRLKETHLELRSFINDNALTVLSWNATKLSIIFDILLLSSDSLKSLYLDLDVKQGSPEEEFNLISSLLHCVNIIKHLKSFKALYSVVVYSNLNFTLESGSAGKTKELQVYKVDEQDVYNQEWELDENYGSIMSSLLGAVLDFTGSEITRLDYSSCSGGGLYTFGRLDQLQSKSALKTIGLDLEGTEPEYQQVFQHISTYPNLNDFYLYSSARASTPLEFRVPVGGLVSKMEVVQIRFHDRSNSRLVINDEFAKWLSFNKTLAMVIISQPFGDEASSFNDLGSFHSILLNSSQSLTNLTLKGLSLPSGTTAGQVRFHRLRDLELSGNSELINVVMAADFPSLEHSELLIEGRESRFVDHSRILKALESCNSTLKSFQIRLQDTSVAAEVLLAFTPSCETRDNYTSGILEAFGLLRGGKETIMRMGRMGASLFTRLEK